MHRNLRLLAGAGCLALAACGSSAKPAAPTSTTRGTSPAATSSTTSTSTPGTSTTTALPTVGAWSSIPAAPGSLGPPFVWTGTELLAAQSGCCDDLGSIDLLAYDPGRRTWQQLPRTPLTPRAEAAGAWTGTEMIVAGGLASADGTASHAREATDGAAWVAGTNAWHTIAPMPAPLAQATPFAVWTGHEMLVWASVPTFDPTAPGRETVLAFDPALNRWRTLPSSGLTPRAHAAIAWTGHELIVWGGGNALAGNQRAVYGDGARLDPSSGRWQALPPAPVAPRVDATAVWDGHEMLVWGGDDAHGTSVGQGAAYDPATNTWRTLPPSPLRARARAASAWTGHDFVVIGGAANGALPVPGPGAAAYSPSTNTWVALPASPPYPPLAPGATYGPRYASDQRDAATAVWNGTSVLLVGGSDHYQQADRNDGVAWTPAPSS